MPSLLPLTRIDCHDVRQPMVSTGARGPTMGAIPKIRTVIKKLPRLKTPAKPLLNLHPTAATRNLYRSCHSLYRYPCVGNLQLSGHFGASFARLLSRSLEQRRRWHVPIKIGNKYFQKLSKPLYSLGCILKISTQRIQWYAVGFCANSGFFTIFQRPSRQDSLGPGFVNRKNSLLQKLSIYKPPTWRILS